MNHLIYEKEEELQCSCFHQTTTNNHQSGLKRKSMTKKVPQVPQNRKAQSNEDKNLKEYHEAKEIKNKFSLRRQKQKTTVYEPYHHPINSGLSQENQSSTIPNMIWKAIPKQKNIRRNINQQPFNRIADEKQLKLQQTHKNTDKSEKAVSNYPRSTFYRPNIKPINFDNLHSGSQYRIKVTNPPNNLVQLDITLQNKNRKGSYNVNNYETVGKMQMPDFYAQNSSKQTVISQEHPQKYLVNDHQGRFKGSKVHDNHENSKISLSHRNSQFDNGELNGRTLSQFENSIRTSDYHRTYQEAIKSERDQLRLYMKQIQSVVDDNQYNDQISEVVGRGWQINREDEFNDDQNGQPLKKTTLQTLPSNSQNSGTAHSAFGMAQSHFRRF